MTPKQIAALKAAVKEYFTDAARLQYHPVFDTVSGYGRYALARRMCMPDRWETVYRDVIEF